MLSLDHVGLSVVTYSFLNQLWLITSAAVDILIAVAMTFLVRNAT